MERDPSNFVRHMGCCLIQATKMNDQVDYCDVEICRDKYSLNSLTFLLKLRNISGNNLNKKIDRKEWNPFPAE